MYALEPEEKEAILRHTEESALAMGCTPKEVEEGRKHCESILNEKFSHA